MNDPATRDAAADEKAREAIAEYQAYIASHPRDELNALLRQTIRELRQQIRHRREIRNLVGA